MVPQRWVRRLVVAPLVPVVALLVLTSIPLSALVAAVVSPLLPGRWRPLRLLLFAVVWLVTESLTLVVAAVLWVASGFGRHLDRPRWQAAHFRLMRIHLDVLVHAARRAFNLAVRVEVERAHDPVDEPDGAGPDADLVAAAVAPQAPPLVVLCRHAGPGDSFLLIHDLLRRGRRPRIVLRDTLQWAPSLDIVLNRVPSAFVGSRGTHAGARQSIVALASTIGPGDALVLFPEGRNFTARRRLHSIERLEELGRHAEADRARGLRHVLTPRPGGALAAIREAADANVAFVGHTGLEGLSSLVDLWRGIPMDTEVRAKVWTIARPALENDGHLDAEWLYAWWRRIDTWIIGNSGTAVVPDAIVAEMTGPAAGRPGLVGEPPR